jgi:hypothetical protein
MVALIMAHIQASLRISQTDVLIQWTAEYGADSDIMKSSWGHHVRSVACVDCMARDLQQTELWEVVAQVDSRSKCRDGINY